jgi:HEAT repeat protein
VALLGSNSNSSVQKAATSALGNLARDPHIQPTIAALHGALSSLVALLGSNNSSGVQKAAARALHNLAVHNPTNKAGIAAVPCELNRLVALLGSTNSSVVQQTAAGALRKLARHPANRTRLASMAALPGAPSSLVALLA